MFALLPLVWRLAIAAGGIGITIFGGWYLQHSISNSGYEKCQYEMLLNSVKQDQNARKRMQDVEVEYQKKIYEISNRTDGTNPVTGIIADTIDGLPE